MPLPTVRAPPEVLDVRGGFRSIGVQGPVLFTVLN